jgi:DNA excision repair protein ERCC-4
VTSRILIVDMLNGLVPWKKLGGIIYYMGPGQLIKENSTENFILRVYAQQVFNANQAFEQASKPQKTTDSQSSTSLSSNVQRFDGYNDATEATVNEKNASHKLGIKIFTESPYAFARGWNTLEKLTRTLKVGTKVYMWPRFRKAVNDCIKARQPESVQLHIDLAPIQAQIHQNLVTIFKLCVDDLKRRCSGNPLATPFGSPPAMSSFISPQLQESDISYDKALFSNFYSGIQSILEPLGSKVPRKIQSLLYDISLLRRLLSDLIRCDAVKFYEKFQNILRDNSTGDGAASLDWLHYSEADAVNSLAQERLWKTPAFKSPFNDKPSSRSKSEEISSSSPPPPPPPPPLTLEDNPKWRALISVIQEIELENSNPTLDLGSQPILILTRDEETRYALSEYLSLSNPSHYLLSRLRKHITRKVEMFETNKLTNKSQKQQNFFADTKQSARQRTTTSPSTPNHQVSSSSSPTPKQQDDSDFIEPSLSSSPISTVPINSEERSLYNALLDQVEERVQLDMAQKMSTIPEIEDNDSIVPVLEDHNEFDKYFGLIQSDSTPTNDMRKTPIVIQAWETHFSGLPSFFEDVNPHFVILYDPDPAIVRQVECYKAGRPGWFVRLYVMIYKDSLEHDKYMAILKQEQEIFQKLVAQKGKLAEEDVESQADIVSRVNPTANQGGSSRQGGTSSLPNASLVLGSGIISTKVQASNASNQSIQAAREEVVIVDMREFRSKLPGMLHQHGITIKPQTLVIADYILSPDIAVERKSIPDLKQSFRSGHLYNQIENLTRIYPKPILLIEFDSSEAFELASSDKLQQGGFSIHDLHSQLALLTKAFPKMRVCWSRSPAQTAQLFLALKRGKPQPNAAQVLQHHIGLNPELSSHAEEIDAADEQPSSSKKKSNRRLLAAAGGTDEAAPAQNSAPVTAPNLSPFYPIDVLQRIPGLNKGSNWKPLLFPAPLPTSSSSPIQSRDTSPSKPIVKSTSPVISPSKLPDNPLDGSLFELDADDELFEPADMAPLDLPPRHNLASLSTPSSPTQPPPPPKALPSLAALADMPLTSLTSSIGTKLASEVHTFLHHRSDVTRLQKAVKDAGDSAKSRNALRGGRGGNRGGSGGGRGARRSWYK